MILLSKKCSNTGSISIIQVLSIPHIHPYSIIRIRFSSSGLAYTLQEKNKKDKSIIIYGLFAKDYTYS